MLRHEPRRANASLWPWSANRAFSPSPGFLGLPSRAGRTNRDLVRARCKMKHSSFTTSVTEPRDQRDHPSISLRPSLPSSPPKRPHRKIGVMSEQSHSADHETPLPRPRPVPGWLLSLGGSSKRCHLLRANASSPRVSSLSRLARVLPSCPPFGSLLLSTGSLPRGGWRKQHNRSAARAHMAAKPFHVGRSRTAEHFVQKQQRALSVSKGFRRDNGIRPRGRRAPHVSLQLHEHVIPVLKISRADAERAARVLAGGPFADGWVRGNKR
jgi:hypothetical protein